MLDFLDSFDPLTLKFNLIYDLIYNIIYNLIYEKIIIFKAQLSAKCVNLGKVH